MQAETTLDFAYRDKQLLVAGQHRGGRLWLPRHRRRRGARLPMVVMLHGIDKSGRSRAHRLLGGGVDLRPAVSRLVRAKRIRPVLMAAPSQTRRAKSSRTLWTPQGFDLASFVAAVERRLATLNLRVDRTQLAVVAHSGAGCHLSGKGGNGVFHLIRGLPQLRRKGYRIHWVGLMDTCFFGSYGAHWLRRALRGTKTRVAAMWTGPVEWGPRRYRRIRAFTRSFAVPSRASCDPKRYAACRTGPHGWWLFAARREVLRKTLGDRSGKTRPQSPHSALTTWFMEELLTRWIPA